MPLSGSPTTEVYAAPKHIKLLIIGAATAAASLAALAAILWPQQKPKKLPEPETKEPVPEEQVVTMPQDNVAVATPVKPIEKVEQKSPSWSDLVEDDERQMAEMSEETKLTPQISSLDISSPKAAPSDRGDFDTGDTSANNLTRNLDSGVVSPNENHIMQPSQSKNPVKSRIESGETPDGGLGSSLCGEEPEQRPKAAGSDSGQGSEADDGIRMAYHFYIPSHLCGKLIGAGGVSIKQLKQSSKCTIQLREIDENGYFKSFTPGRQKQVEKSAEKESHQVCIVEGTRSCIDHCLDLIRQKFPLDQYEKLTLEQINMPTTSHDNYDPNMAAAGAAAAPAIDNSQQGYPAQLGLIQGVMHEVYVSSIVCGGHVFLQQPNHPTHGSLRRLENLMQNAYTKLPVPDVPRELIEHGLMCVARCNHQWFRVQVVRYDSASDTCDVKFVDYGGFFNLPVSDLRQIRSDFLSLPFQALECYLGNVMPPNGHNEWPAESAAVLAEMVANQIISGRMLGVNVDCVPIVHLYGWVSPTTANGASDVSMHEQQPRLLNRELVDRGVAKWTEHITA